MRSFKRKVLAVGLSTILTVNMTITGYASPEVKVNNNQQSMERLGFFDGLDAFGNATATIGCILNVGSVLANADWDDPGGVCLDLVDTIFGTSFGGDPVQESLDAIYGDVEEIKKTTNDIKDTVDYLKANSYYVNSQLSAISKDLKYTRSMLDKQEHTLNEIKGSIKSMNDEMTQSFADLTDLINRQTDTIKSAVYSSTAEIKKTTELNTALTNYVSNYSKLYTYDNNILNSLSTMQDTYTAFYNEIMKLDNGTEVIEALNKISLKEDSVSKLTSKDQDLLQNTYVTVSGKKQQVLKYHLDYVKSLMEFVAGTGDNTHSVFTLNGNVGNLGDTVLEMGDYLTAENKTFNALTGNRGIGELYYVYCTFSNKDSITVHKKYKSFMDSMVAQYMTTAWLAEMAYGYRIADEANGNNNATVIRGYEQYLNDIHTQMVKVSAYYEYEYRNCVITYDFGGEAYGHDQDVVMYGNTESDGQWSVEKKREFFAPSNISDENITLALGEEYDLHYYYRFADVTRRKGIKWTSSNPQVAAVDNYGEVLGLSRGVATIKAEYAGTTAECVVSIGDVMAVPNDDSVNRYHYYKYYSSGGNWVTDDTPVYEVASERGYDFYYGVTTYTTDTIELSEDVRSASIIKTTGMTDENMDAFTWFTTGDGAVQMDGYDVAAVSGGWSEVIGYRKNDEEHTYDFIGIPVHSTMDTLFKDSAIDYSTYTEISTAQDLIDLSNNPEGWGTDSKYVLTADIDLGGMEWNPIGYSLGLGAYDGNAKFTQTQLGVNHFYASLSAANPFSGTFDGNGHTISNFKITKIPRADAIQEQYDRDFYEGSGNEYSSYSHTLGLAAVGLFGYVNGAHISNLNVTDANINIDTTKPTGVYLNGEEVEYDKTFTVFAGALAGASKWDALALQMEKAMAEFQSVTEGEDVDYEALAMELYERYEAPDRFMEYYNEFKKNSDDSAQKLAMICLVYGMWNAAKNTEVQGLEGCYATGNIKVNNTTTEGGVYAGIVSGGSDANFANCTTIGTIDVKASFGAAGGITGYQFMYSDSYITDCTTDVTISALGGVAAGGLCGITEGSLTLDYDMFGFVETDTAEDTVNKASAFEFMYILMALAGFGTMRAVDVDDPNATMSRNQVLGTVIGSAKAGGLVGYKTASAKDKDYMIIMRYNMLTQEGVMINYNIDMVNNYVACDVTSNNGYAGGLIGLCDPIITTPDSDEGNDSQDGKDGKDDKEEEEETKAEYKVTRAQICKNYYTGKINAGSQGYAAGLIAMVESDYADLIQNISAATSIKGGGKNKVAYAINGRENGVDLITGTTDEYNVKGALCYNGITEWAGDDSTTKGDDSVFDDPNTYKEIFGDDNFLDLSGGLKADGETGLDLASGLIPKKLGNRFRFPLETVPQTYHQGDEFVAVTSVYSYTGTGTELIKTGVESTVPDMKQIGVQTVTVTYGDYTEEYDICIYPAAGYLKIDGKPVVAKDGSTIVKGKVTAFVDGDKQGKTINIDDCTVVKGKDNIFTIKSGKYTTALRPVMADVYTNNVDTGAAEFVGREYFTQGTEADVSDLVPDVRKVKDKEYKLLGTSQDLKFKTTNDICVLTYYGTDAGGNGNGNGNGNGSKVTDPYAVDNAVVTGIKNKTWNGKNQTQKITVTLSGKTLTLDKDYKVTYKDNKNVGLASVIITGTGKYKGTLTKNFKIKPKKIKKIKSVKAGRKSLTVKWKKLKKKMSKKRITGYQIWVSTSKKFKKGTKKIKVKGYKKQSVKIKKLKAGKKYFIKIRTYMKVNGKTYYSAWSKIKTKKTR